MMDIDECYHEWDFETNVYLPVIESIRTHHPCAKCGVINNHPERRQLKTGALIALIKEMFEKNGVPRTRIRDYTEQIIQMKRDGVFDTTIIVNIMSEVDCKVDLNWG